MNNVKSQFHIRIIRFNSVGLLSEVLLINISALKCVMGILLLCMHMMHFDFHWWNSMPKIPIFL